MESDRRSATTPWDGSISYGILRVEVTRRCNQECVHCLRGRAQPVDLGREAIRAFFENNNISQITHLIFSGGEPSLNGEAIDYFSKQIVDRKIPLYAFSVATNGKHYSEPMANGLCRLYGHCTERHPSSPFKDIDGVKFMDRFSGAFLEGMGTGLCFSVDQYHDPLDEYVVNQYRELPFFREPKFREWKFGELCNSGNAAKNSLPCDEYDWSRNLRDFSSGLRIIDSRKRKMLVLAEHHICANGEYGVGMPMDYETTDTCSIGNIAAKSVVEMLTGLDKSSPSVI